MKKMMILAMMAVVAVTTVNAQSQRELVKQEIETIESIKELSKAKKVPRWAKKKAKEYKKQGFIIEGILPMENQIYIDYLYSDINMKDASGTKKRYYVVTNTGVQGTIEAAFDVAQNAAQLEIASLLDKRLGAIMTKDIDGDTRSVVDATTVDRYNKRGMSIVKAALTNQTPGLKIYRILENNIVEAKYTVIYDKMEVLNQLKRQLKNELQLEGDKLDGILDKLMSQDLEK